MINVCLEETIMELTGRKNDDCIMSGGVLAWAKRVEAQRAKAAVLNTLTKSRQFDKIKLFKEVKEDKARTPVHQTTPQQPCRYCGAIHQPRHCPAYGKMCTECSKLDTSRRSATVGRTGWSLRWSKCVIGIHRRQS